jgi:hypothetical protein
MRERLNERRDGVGMKRNLGRGKGESGGHVTKNK